MIGILEGLDEEQLLLHVITEVARHAGHLDAARELLDGRTWLSGNPYVPQEAS